jgi:hypothetical protein
MKRDSVVAIVQALNEMEVQYLIVGGLAVVAHGYLRLTADVDLILAPDTGNLERAVDAISDDLIQLKTLSNRPEDKADIEKLKQLGKAEHD